jgi:flavin reductase (DIM6/NTAB) family NADH-FMN oxidoreductase RutF
MPITDDLKKLLAKPLGKLPSGVYILTASHEGKQSAMLASWVQQASFDPPCISIAIGRERPIFPLIQGSSRLALAVIPQNDSTLLKKYARGPADPNDPFKDVPTLTTPSGIPAPSNAVAVLEANLMQTVDFGADHALLIAQVTWGQVLLDTPPNTHVRNNGFNY